MIVCHLHCFLRDTVAKLPDSVSLVFLFKVVYVKEFLFCYLVCSTLLHTDNRIIYAVA